jgi:hypothetical protein
MILPSTLALTLALGARLLMPVAEGVPVLNVGPVCQGIAQQGGSSFHDPAIAKEKQDCLQSETEVRNQLVKQWSNFSATDKNACVNEATMGGESSYTELLTCLEMARDVHDLGKQSAAPASPPKRSR